MIISKITEAIGNTPLLEINSIKHQILGVDIFAKLEYLNPFGSIKDRTALGLLEDYLKNKNGNDIIESSSGNTAKALGAILGIHGKKLHTVTNRIKIKEIADTLRLMGVTIQELPPGSECPDPNDPDGPFQVIQNHMKLGKFYWTDQYTNKANVRIHKETTAHEIYSDLGEIDYFFSGLGTTGSSRGIIEYYQEKRVNIHAIGIITAKGSYIPGIRNSNEMQEVGLYERNLYETTIEVTEQEAIDEMQILIQEYGILVGPTTGGTYAGMKKYFTHYPAKTGSKAVFIACDRVEPYINYLKERAPEIFGNTMKSPAPKVNNYVVSEINIFNFYQNKDTYFLIDMRSYRSYKLEHIAGSLNFSFDSLQICIQQGYLPFSKTIPLCFICPYGEESLLMSQIAVSLGWTAVSLKGGLEEYRMQKYPLSNNI